MENDNSDDNVVKVHGVDLSMVYRRTPDVPCFDAIHMHLLCWEKVLDALLQLWRHCNLSRVTIMNALREKMEGKKATKGGGLGSQEESDGIVGED